MYKAGLVFILLVALTEYTTARRGVCRFVGKTYRVGQEFVDKGCTAHCRCVSTGAVSCKGLCGVSGITCGAGEEESEKMVPVYDGRCSCPRPICVKIRNHGRGMFHEY